MLTGRRAYPRWLIRGLVLFAIGMTVFAAVASREHHSAESGRNQALSEYVALESRGLAQSDPALASQLALVAYRLWQTPPARSALLDATAGEIPTRLLGTPGKTGLALGDDGHRLAISYQTAGQVKIFAVRYAHLAPLATIVASSPGARIDSLAISHRGDLLAVGDSAGRVALWSLSSPRHPRQLTTLNAGSGAAHGLSFSPGGAALAAADADGVVQRWSLADPLHPVAAAALVAPGRPALLAVSYSHTGNTLASAGRAGSLVIWPAHGGPKPLAVHAVGGRALTALSYSSDGRWLAVGAKDGLTRVWRLNREGLPQTATAAIAGAGSITSLAFSRDSRFLAVGAAARTAWVVSTSGWRRVAGLPHRAGVTGVAFASRDRRVLTSDTVGGALLWQFPPPSSYATGSAVTGLSFSLTRPRLTVNTLGGSQQWDVADEWRPAPVGAWDALPLSAAPPTAYWVLRQSTTSTSTTTTTSSTTTATDTITAANSASALRQSRALSKVTTSLVTLNGQLLAVAGADDDVYLWKLTDPAGPELVNTLTGPTTPITRLAASPDGRQLAVGTAGGHVWLFWVGTPARASLVARLTAAGGRLTALAYSPSDDTLVAGGANQRLTFWHFRPYQAVNRICALAGTPITPREWATYVPQAPYNPPCARWTPPVAPQVSGPTG